jgi:CO/xanthine dehydrogenase FAD-binding subunit
MPSLTTTGYLRPDSLGAALEALEPGCVAVAGGTAVILHPPPGTHTLVDLSTALPAGIEERDGAHRIGAMTSLTAMLEHPGLGALYDGVVGRMLRLVGSPLLRNAATIGGHLGRGRLSDVIPLLIAVGASVEVYDGGTETLPLEDYYRRGRHRERALVTHVAIPSRPAHSAAGFHKLSRTHFDLAMLNGAVRIVLGDDATVAGARIVVGETPALGARAPRTEAVLAGSRLDPETIGAAAAAARREVEVAGDSRASAEYRTHLVGVVVTRCLTEAAGYLEGGAA